MINSANAAAFQEGTPIQEDFGNNMLQAEQMQFKYREEKRINAENNRVKQKEEDEALAASLSKIKNVITGVDSADEIYMRSAALASERLGDIYRRKKSGNISPEERQNLIIEESNITKFPDLVTGASKHMQEHVAKLTKGIEDGTISEWEMGQAEEIGAFFGVRDENGRMTPNFIMDFDKKGNTVAKIITQSGEYKEVSILDIYNGGKYSDAAAATESGVYTKGIVDNLGKRQVEKMSGGLLKVYQDFESQRGPVGEMISAALGTAEEPTDLAKSMWADSNNLGKSPKDFGKESIEEIKTFLMTKIEAGYDQTMQASQLRAQGGGGEEKLTGTERKRQSLAVSVYNNVHLGANGDEAALGMLNGRSKKIGDDYVTAGKAFPTEDSIVILDNSGNTLETIPMSEPEKVRASKLLAWYSDGDPSEGRDLYNIGMDAMGGMPESPTTVAQKRVAKEVPALDVEKVKKMGAKSVEAFITSIKSEFPKDKTGIEVGPTSMFEKGDFKIRLGGNEKTFTLDKKNPDKMKQEVYTFLFSNQLDNKTIYVMPEKEVPAEEMVGPKNKPESNTNTTKNPQFN